MRIVKIYNNNAVETKDKDCREIIVVGCGLAFKKRVGDKIDDSKIQKIFVLSEPGVNVKFREFLSYIPLDYLTMGNEIIGYIQEKLHIEQSTLLYLSLVDHIYGAVKRYQSGIEVKNVMLWDIRRFYSEEYTGCCCICECLVWNVLICFLAANETPDSAIVFNRTGLKTHSFDIGGVQFSCKVRLFVDSVIIYVGMGFEYVKARYLSVRNPPRLLRLGRTMHHGCGESEIWCRMVSAQ